MVDFEVTHECPNKCFFCEANLENVIPVPPLSTRECFSVFEKLAGGGVLCVFLTGGEPLARSDLPDLIRCCVDVGLEPTVSTSGLYLSQANLHAMLDAGLDHLQVSLHGHGPTHDLVVRMPGAYARTLVNLQEVTATGIDVEVACVGLRENFESIPSLIDELASIGVKMFRILRYLPSHDRKMLEHIPPRRMVLDLMPRIERIAAEHNVSLMSSFCPGLVPEPRRIYQGVHPMALSCPAGKTEFAILPNGDVYPCVNLKDGLSMHIGNILKDSVATIWDHPTMLRLRRLTPDDYTGTCGECDRKCACYSARCIAYNLAGDICGDDLSCYVVREKLGYDV